MTPKEFIQKWKRVEQKERSVAQQHFLDLCELLGHDKPAAIDPTGEWFTFEKGVEKRGGEDGFADVWKKGFFAWEYKGKHKDLEDAWRQLDEYRSDLENPPLLVTCDTDRFEIHTSFTNSPHVVHVVKLEELAQPEKLDYLRSVFYEPEKLRPGRISKVITTDAAEAFGAVAQALRARGVEPLRVARFLDRMIFCLFAEDIAMLPNEIATKLLERSRGNPELFAQLSGDLFARMATGGYFGVDVIPHFNGHLFDNAESILLTASELELLWQGARLDWSAIDPSIFGTLFERGLDPGKRSQLGAHYTSKEDIETLVEPVVMTPLRHEWAETKAIVSRLLATGKKEDTGAQAQTLTVPQEKKVRGEASLLLERFLRRLETVTVLDPACGSGNFLYVTLRKLKDLEAEVYDFILESGLQAPLRVGVGPWQLYGIEINQYAHELAQMTVWIGYLQWLRQHGTTAWKEPILQAMSNIECKDAILDLSDPETPKEPTWPKVDFIVGNPPFLGGKLLRRNLGDEYIDRLFEVWRGRVPAEADLCAYWFEKARQKIQVGSARRAGLLATQAIRGGANREVLEAIARSGAVFFAVSDREWFLDGAAVHVSMVGFDDGADKERWIDGQRVDRIHSNLAVTLNLQHSVRLRENSSLSFMGITPSGPFVLSEAETLELLRLPNPHGRPNSDVLRPWFNGSDLTRRHSGSWIVDFFGLASEAEAALFEAPFKAVRERVEEARKDFRTGKAGAWIFERPRPEMRRSLAVLGRFAARSMVAKIHHFVWLPTECLPANLVIVVASEEDQILGILHSRLHEVWALAQGTQLEDRPRYTPTTCFETFPFPHPEKHLAEAIAAAARELDQLRQRWLNPPEWTREEVLEFPGSLDGPWKRFVVDPDARGIGTVRWPRVVARDEEAAEKLAKRTLTKLYNERPAWLDHAHRKLDEAVFAAYGWPADLTDEQILERLLALNLERAAAERSGC